jgi:hypothetical protein
VQKYIYTRKITSQKNIREKISAKKSIREKIYVNNALIKTFTPSFFKEQKL